MKTFFLMIGCVFFVESAFSQVSAADTTNSQDSIYVCSYDYGFAGQTLLQDNTEIKDYKSIVQSMFTQFYYGLIAGNPNSVTLEGTRSYNYAAAGMKLIGQTPIRILYYNNSSLKSVEEKFGLSWELKSIILHEIGHHVNGDVFTKAKTRNAEWWADYFAGFHSRQLGASKKQALSAINEYCKVSPTGYPSQTERLKAVTEGWDNSQQLQQQHLLSFMQSAVEGSYGIGYSPWSYKNLPKEFKQIYKPLKIDTLNSKLQAIVRIQINRVIDFEVRNDSLLYKVNNDFVFAGVLVQSNLPQYKKMIFDKYFNYWYIDERNRIYQKNGTTFDLIGDLKVAIN